MRGIVLTIRTNILHAREHGIQDSFEMENAYENYSDIFLQLKRHRSRNPTVGYLKEGLSTRIMIHFNRILNFF